MRTPRRRRSGRLSGDWMTVCDEGRCRQRCRQMASSPGHKRANPLVRDVGRGGIEPPTLRFSGGCSYRLSYLPPARPTRAAPAVPTGLEPATSALTGRRELLASPRDLAVLLPLLCRLLSCLRAGVMCVPPTGFEPVLPP